MTDLAACARRALACLDLTSLGEDDDAERIARLCASADTPFGTTAAVCVYPEWIVTARSSLDRLGLARVAVATVVNFPEGGSDPARVGREIRRARAAGADEIDLVIPWRSLRAGDSAPARAVLAEARRCCGPLPLKAILESGALGSPARIREASLLALDAGADFLKTSTGKVETGATLEAAAVMLTAIRERGGRCGFKAAGGIRRVAEAADYFALADTLLGAGWATPARFRIGASSLLDDIRGRLGSGPHHADGD